jgi:hypothetical protein
MARSDEVDLELIAALIDGRLSGEERERAVRLLSESEPAFEVYSDALRARAELPVNAAVVPIGSAHDRRRGLLWRAVGSVAAAAVILIAVVPLVRQRLNTSALDATSAELVRPLVMPALGARQLVGEWDSRDWTATRGATESMVDSTTAFRLGVRVVDLQLALSHQDTLRSRRLVAEIVESLSGVELSESVVVEYSAVRASLEQSGQGEPLGVASRAEAALDDLLGSFWFDFGRWVGAGELAAAARSEEFFTNRRTARFLQSAARRAELSSADAGVLREIADTVEHGVTDQEFETIRQHFKTLIRRRGG